MVKVNYYKVEGFDKHEPTSKGIIYGRSKGDVLKIAEARGFKKGTLEGVRELNFKGEVFNKIFKDTELVALRVKDKSHWKETSKRKPKAE